MKKHLPLLLLLLALSACAYGGYRFIQSRKKDEEHQLTVEGSPEKAARAKATGKTYRKLSGAEAKELAIKLWQDFDNKEATWQTRKAMVERLLSLQRNSLRSVYNYITVRYGGAMKGDLITRYDSDTVIKPEDKNRIQKALITIIPDRLHIVDGKATTEQSLWSKINPFA